jgi:hypothetical protein
VPVLRSLSEMSRFHVSIASGAALGSPAPLGSTPPYPSTAANSSRTQAAEWERTSQRKAMRTMVIMLMERGVTEVAESMRSCSGME